MAEDDCYKHRGLTAEKIQESINEKLSAKTPIFTIPEKITRFTEKVQEKFQEKMRERVCCKMCGILVLLGIFLALLLIIFLVSLRLTPRPVEACNMRCLLRAATWANYTEVQVENIGAANPDEVLNALSQAWIEHHADEFAANHGAKHSVNRLQKAHDQMSGQMKDLGDQWKQALSMPNGPEKVAKLKEIVKRSDSIQAMANAVQEGKSYNEVQMQTMTDEQAYEARDCAEILRTVGVEPCAEDPGTTTGLLRALGVGDVPEQPQPPSPTWPANLQYPGLRTLDAKNDIHVVDNFLTRDECAALLQKSKTIRVQNRSSISQGSFAALHSSSTPKQNSREHHVPKWMYSGMPGALIELDIKGQKDKKDCTPLGNEQTADAWKGAIGPLFQDRGQDLDKCAKTGFGDTRFFDIACPKQSDIAATVESKLERLAQASQSQLQPMKLMHFGRGDYDLDHYDTDALNTNGKVAPMMTAIVYLSEVKGGATYFPNLDLRVDPVPGRALIFPTLTMNLSVVAASLHAEEEVKKGDKWVLGTSVILGHRDQSPNPCTAAN